MCGNCGESSRTAGAAAAGACSTCRLACPLQIASLRVSYLQPGREQAERRSRRAAAARAKMEGAEALIEPSEFDLVVIGTGLTESIVAA